MSGRKAGPDLAKLSFGGISVNIIIGEINLYSYLHKYKAVNFNKVHERLCKDHDKYKASGITADDLEAFYLENYVPEWDAIWIIGKIQTIILEDNAAYAVIDWKDLAISDPKNRENWILLNHVAKYLIKRYFRHSSSATRSFIELFDTLKNRKLVSSKIWDIAKKIHSEQELGAPLVVSDESEGAEDSDDSETSSSCAIVDEPPIKQLRQASSARGDRIEDLSSTCNPPEISESSGSRKDDGRDKSESTNRRRRRKRRHDHGHKYKHSTEEDEQETQRKRKLQREDDGADADSIGISQGMDQNAGCERYGEAPSGHSHVQSHANAVSQASVFTATAEMNTAGAGRLPIEANFAERLQEVCSVIEAGTCQIKLKLPPKGSDNYRDARIVFSTISSNKQREPVAELTLAEIAGNSTIAVYVLAEFVKGQQPREPC